MYSPPTVIFSPTILLSFASDGLFTVIGNPRELLEMQIEATLKLMVLEILISTEAEDSDHDEEFALANGSVRDGGSDSDGG